MDILKIYLFLYKLKKCLIAQFKGINLMARIFIFILFGIAVFQQFYYPRVIEQTQLGIKKHLDYLQLAYNNITNAMEDLQAEVEDFTSEDWHTNDKKIKLFLDDLDGKISYFGSSINNYYTPSRAQRQKLLF